MDAIPVSAGGSLSYRLSGIYAEPPLVVEKSKYRLLSTGKSRLVTRFSGLRRPVRSPAVLRFRAYRTSAQTSMCNPHGQEVRIELVETPGIEPGSAKSSYTVSFTRLVGLIYRWTGSGSVRSSLLSDKTSSRCYGRSSSFSARPGGYTHSVCTANAVFTPSFRCDRQLPAKTPAC